MIGKGLRKAILMLAFVITGVHLSAQNLDTAVILQTKSPNYTSKYSTWTIGLSAGLSTPYTLVGYNSRQDFTSPDVQLGYGLNIKDQLTYEFGLQADFFAGKLRGDHAQQILSSGAYLYSSFDTKINWSASLSANFTVAHFYNSKHHSVAEPYLSIGGGIMSYTPVLHSYFTSPVYMPSSSAFYFPLAAGIKFNLTRAINLDLGYQVSFSTTDDVDGYKYGGTNDRFSYTHIGLEFILGDHRKPHLASVSRASVLIDEAQLREKRMQTTYDDQIEQLKVKNNKLNNDLEIANKIIARYAEDNDGDGVPDFMDKCPNTPAGAKVDGSGCPLPEEKPVAKVEAKSELTLEDWRVVTNTMRSLEFYSGTAVISESAFPDLNKLVQLIISKKQLLKIEVYVANSGKSEADLKLSNDRAEAIKGYLANKGVNAANINAIGYGNAKPIASNKTAKGRKINERVILTLN